MIGSTDTDPNWKLDVGDERPGLGGGEAGFDALGEAPIALQPRS